MTIKNLKILGTGIDLYISNHLRSREEDGRYLQMVSSSLLRRYYVLNIYRDIIDFIDFKLSTG
jgi:hypothetical protein